MKRLLLIVFFLGYCACSWTTPKKLTHAPIEATFPQMYIDPVTKATHMLWIENHSTEFHLVYSRQDSNKVITAPIKIETRFRARLSQIIGAGDGKHLMLTYDAKRVQGDDSDCTKDDHTGCYEIFFAESFDGGNTWSKPVQILRDDMKDGYDRKGPRVTYVNETKLTYLTYWRTGSMAYSTRKGTGTFSKETIFPFGPTTAYQSITHTVNPDTKKVTLHFTYTNWRYPTEWLMYVNSSDEGKTWNRPKILDTNMHQSTYDSYIRSYMVSNSAIVPRGVFIAYIRANQVMLLHSKDEGASWSKPLYTHRADAIAPRIQLCKQPNNKPPKLHLLLAVRKAMNRQSFVYGTLDLNTYTYKNEEFPFSGLVFNWDYMLDCYVDGGKSVAGAIVESYSEELNSIFVSYNDDL